MEILLGIFNFIIHFDVRLGEAVAHYGSLSYAFLFAILFIETGLVLTPFLPGDSLLFAAGAFAAIGSLNVVFLLVLLFVAAFLGDTVNFLIGRFLGQKLVDNPRVPVNQDHIEKTKKFFDKYGGKAIFLARFAPIIRTFAPFVAGIGKMDYKKFIFYNATGGFAWVFGFTLLGYFFGNIPGIKKNFSIVILAIIILSVAPILVEVFRKRPKTVAK